MRIMITFSHLLDYSYVIKGIISLLRSQRRWDLRLQSCRRVEHRVEHLRLAAALGLEH